MGAGPGREEGGSGLGHATRQEELGVGGGVRQWPGRCARRWAARGCAVGTE
jgi:hypothetical protein